MWRRFHTGELRIHTLQECLHSQCLREEMNLGKVKKSQIYGRHGSLQGLCGKQENIL
jgi:hypothetical protein